MASVLDNKKKFLEQKTHTNNSQFSRSSKPLCRYYKAGYCSKGDNCSFSHNFYHNTREFPRPYHAPKNNSRTFYPRHTNMPICRYFKRGFCNAGSRCEFYHPRNYNRNASRKNIREADNETVSQGAEESSEQDDTELISKPIQDVFTDVDVSCDKEITDNIENLAILKNVDISCDKEIIDRKNQSLNTFVKQIDPKDGIKVNDVETGTSMNKIIPLSLNKVSYSSLTDEEISQLWFTEITQFKKRYPNYETVDENNSFVFAFEPTDPDWPFDLKSLKLQVTFPKMYPKEICTISVIRGDDYIQETLLRHINQSIFEWLSSKHKSTAEDTKVELLFRPFLKWFDRNLEDIFNVGLKREKEELENTSIQLESLKIYPTLRNINLSADIFDEFQDEATLELSTSETNESKEKSHVPIQHKKPSPSLLINNSQKQGVKVLFTGLEFIEGVAALTCTKVASMLRCIRCKTSCNLKSPPNKNMAVNCSKCSRRMECNFNPSLLHQFSSVLGTMHLVECQVVDINLVESAFLIDCLNCSKQVGVDGIHYGQKQKLWCMFCNQKLAISIGSVKFQGSAPTNATSKTSDKAVKKTEKKKDPLIKEGGPLPQNGACKHYKKSNRWLRFPCCGRVYPCDVCHEEKEMDHEMKFASRMICGFCSKEQPYTKDKPCVSCTSGMVAKSGAHWEGGKGCRNKVKMARDDKHKYSGTSKTVSKKTQNSGKKKK